MPAILRSPRHANRSSRYANVVSTVALIFAITGTATAARVTLITGSEVQNGSLTGADLANRSVGFRKLTQNAVNRLKGTTGDRGATGLQGAAGPAGSVGPTGASGPAGAPGQPGPTGNDGTGIRLAGYAKTNDQTLPDDSDFHTVWTMNINVEAQQLFILTGAIGGAGTPGCSGGNLVTERALVDGSPAAFTAFLTFDPGAHTLSYEVRGDCPGSPAQVSAQEAVLIPFTLP